MGQLLLPEVHRELHIGLGLALLGPCIREIKVLSPMNSNGRLRPGEPIEPVF
jgi:hypothetical protein